MFNTNKNYVYTGKHSDTLIVTFTGYCSVSGFSWKFLLNHGFDMLFIKDSMMRWYLCGIDGVSHDVDSTFLFLKKYTDRYKKVVTIGSSMGGFAALLYGSKLNSDVYAFSPQVDISPCSKWCTEWTSNKVLKNVHPFINNNDRRYLNITNNISDKSKLYFGSRNAFDSKLNRLQNCDLFPVDTNIHEVAVHLQKHNKLNRIVTQI